MSIGFRNKDVYSLSPFDSDPHPHMHTWHTPRYGSLSLLLSRQVLERIALNVDRRDSSQQSPSRSSTAVGRITVA